MPSIGAYYFSKTEVDIISSLFIFRSGTAEQVTYMIQPELAPEGFANNAGKRSVYTGRIKYIAKTLSGLQKKGLVALMKPVHTMKFVYYLTQEGLNCAYSIFGIEEHSANLASGWPCDYGYFEYTLYKPSLDRFSHHDLSLNYHLQMLNFAALRGFKYEFIDNRYASREFYTKKQGKNVKRYFRPDGEFKINDKNHYWLEVDMSTERGEKLADKFESYRDYLDVISEGISFSEINETPRSIVFHSSATYITVRWISVFNAFMSKMEKYTPLINFRLTNNSTLSRAADAEVNSNSYLNKVKTNIQIHLKRESGFVGLPDSRSSSPSFIKLLSSDEDALGWSPNIVIVENSDGSKQILLFERLEGLESLGIARIIDLNKKLQELEIGRSGQIKEIIPILYYYDITPDETTVKGTGVDMVLRRTLSKLIVHDAKNNLWFDGFNNIEIKGNPLMYRRD
ncbi:replication-relaxation family protein [Paenibacillus glucanolyticus]|jgi:hypothetical protein|uniref:Replication-relaxation n=1 Tax=Paenibacillus glucanolyticus TaxID=59843 RepID=A0A163GN16_9BACL|nr:replication-relaxation family protein [Paenibacillus glucanolyticus]KZS45053.1 hypothetical protein AWU65_03465 [Paenibacillus glucanolyticus]OMF63873.1 hypothetical protein BK142_32405 [Paenibacillus glucanolyticus]